jgi:hypothetical protein
MIIALGHTKGVGKDTIANSMIVEACNYQLKAQKIAFADAVKDVAYQLYHSYGIEERMYYEQNREAKDEMLPMLCLTPRQVWIDLSDNLARIAPRLWFDLTMDKIKANTDIAIVTDLRYMREARFLSALGSKVATIRVLRDGCIMQPDGAEEQLSDYVFDATLVNDYTLQQLTSGSACVLAPILEHLRGL